MLSSEPCSARPRVSTSANPRTMMTKSFINRRPHRILHVVQALKRLRDNCPGIDVQMVVNESEALAYLEKTDEDGIFELAQLLYERRNAYKTPAVGQKALELLDTLAPPDVPVVTVLVEIPERDSRQVIESIRQYQRRCPGMIVEIA